MTNPRMANLVDRLYVATCNSLVAWKETGQVYVFQAPFHTYTVVVSAWLRKGGAPNEQDYAIDLLDRTGRHIERIDAATYGELRDDATAGFELFAQLHKLARYRALDIDEAIDTVLEDVEEALQSATVQMPYAVRT